MEIFFVLFAIMFVAIIGMNIMRFVKNENSPIVATRARVVDRKTETHTHSGGNGAMHTSTTYYLIFELDTASTVKLSVRGRNYKAAVFGEWGTLTFQGTRFLKFESPSVVLEK